MPSLQLPDNYIPYDEVILCGNTMRNGKVPIAVDGRPVFLIGKTSMSAVWLQVPTGKNWRYEIENGVSKDSAYRVAVSGNSVSMYFGPHLLLRAEKKSVTTIQIDHVDLTRFGLSIHGDPNSLHVGGTTISGNTFDGIETMINVG